MNSILETFIIGAIGGFGGVIIAGIITTIKRLIKSKDITMKWLAQVLGSIIYTLLFSALMYIIIVWPLAWLITLSGFWKFVVFFLFYGLFLTLITTVLAYATMPYVWLHKENIVATVLSIGILSLNTVLNAVYVWKACAGNSFGITILSIITIGLLLRTLIGAIILMTKCYSGTISN